MTLSLDDQRSCVNITSAVTCTGKTGRLLVPLYYTYQDLCQNALELVDLIPIRCLALQQQLVMMAFMLRLGYNEIFYFSTS